MNTPILIQKFLTAFCLLGAATFFLILLAHRFRHHLRSLNARWQTLNPASRCLLILFVTVFVLYGGTKSPTNDPTGATNTGATGTGATGILPVAGLSSRTAIPTGATGVSPVAVAGQTGRTGILPVQRQHWADGHLARRRMQQHAQPLQLDMDNLQLTTAPTATPTNYTSLTAWHKRGAFSDWQRIDFPSSFAFPHGTNLLTSVTLFAYGEIRESLAGSSVCSFVGLGDTQSTNQLTNQPTNQLTLSLEPGASSFTHGLTPSNSYLISWSNVCVNRSPTNRVDASIELYPSGAILMTTQPTNQPTNKLTNYYPPTPPPGFVGSGQDTNWLASVFTPTDYTQITNKGYDAWLSEDYVGVNEQNGHYLAQVTITQPPSTNPQAPIYLVCGPYKVVVTSPGIYSFPLEVFKTYKVRTYPVALPLSISTDDGYRAPLLSASSLLPTQIENEPSAIHNSKFTIQNSSNTSASPVQTASRPRLALSAPPPPEYEICETPRLVISPDTIPLDQAVGTHISIWCNVANAARRYSALISREFRLNFCNPSDAEIVAAEVEDLVEIIIDAPLGTCVGTVSITDLHPCCECGSCTGLGCSCGCACWRHSSSDPSSTNSPSATP